MAALSAFIVLAAVGGLLVWLVLKSRELERRRDLERKVLARKEGWHYDGQRSGRIEYRFTGGADGIDWQMWYDSDRGDSHRRRVPTGAARICARANSRWSSLGDGAFRWKVASVRRKVKSCCELSYGEGNVLPATPP